MAEPVASLVIVAYGGLPLVERLLGTIARHTPQAHEVVLVDNDSPDGLAEAIEATHPRVRLIRAGRNLGYGAGANLGVAQCSARHVVVLNSDVSVEPGWLEPLLRALADPSVAIAAPVTIDPEGAVIEAGAAITSDGHVHLVTGDLDREDPQVVTHASASCWAFRRHWFERVGGFDPLYGLGYYEDVDLSSLASATGHSVVCCPESRILHDVGGSFGSELAQRLSRRNHRRAAMRWRWLTRWSADSPERAGDDRTHGSLLVIGTHVAASLDTAAFGHLRIEVVSDVSAAVALDTTFHVILTDDIERTEEAVRATQPIAEISGPDDLTPSLTRMGIAPSKTPRSRAWSELALAGRGQP